MWTPKKGTLERITLDLLIEHPEGITCNSFPAKMKVTEAELARAVENLRSNIFESEEDDLIKFDA